MNLLLFILGSLYSAFIALICVLIYWIRPGWGQKCHHAFGRGNLWLYGIKVSFIGLENLPKKGGFILTPNHEGMFDILVMASLPCDFSWIAKAETRKIPFIGLSMKALGSHFVKRDRSSADLNVMKEVETALQNGNSILVFPEGTRTRTGEMLPFKKGAFRTAQNAGVPMIPIAISGTRAIAKPGKLPSYGHRVIVRIGKPYTIPKEARLTDEMAKFRDILTNLLSENSSLDKMVGS
jgi:1-acyl-sn-glycerol-3-phosphate acyltransferase